MLILLAHRRQRIIPVGLKMAREDLPGTLSLCIGGFVVVVCVCVLVCVSGPSHDLL